MKLKWLLSITTVLLAIWVALPLAEGLPSFVPSVAALLCLYAIWRPKLMRPEGTRWKRWGRRLGIGAASMAALSLALWSVAEVWTARVLDRVLAESAALGPMTWAALQHPSPPPEENGIWELQSAGAILQHRTGQDRQPFYDHLGKPAWTSEELAAVEKGLAEARSALTLARQAADRPFRCAQLDTGGRNLYATPLPHLGHGKGAAKLLAVAARVEAARGRPDESLADLLRMAHIGRGFEEEPYFVSVLVGLSVLGMTCKTADQVLSDGPEFNPGHLPRLREALRQDPDLYRQGLIGERVCGLDLFARCPESASCAALEEEYYGTEFPILSWIPTWALRPWFRFEEIGYLDLMNEAIRAAPAPAPGFEHIPRYCPLSRLLLTGLAGVHGTIAATRAQGDATRWGLALLEAKASAGRLPTALDEIPPSFLPDNPQDPFSGKPFLYKPDPDGKGFLVYSVGPDGRDDGGSIVPQADRKPVDLGIHWKLP